MTRAIKGYLFLFIFFAFHFVTAQPMLKPRPPREVVSTITNTGIELCPDKRLDYFSVWAEMQDSTIVLKGETSNKTAYDSVLARIKRIVDSPFRNEIKLLPSSDIANPYGVITISTANIRRMPAVESELINQAILGEPVRLLKTHSFFYFIQMPDKYLGWMLKSSIKAMSEVEYTHWNDMKKIVFNRNWGQVYEKPDENSYPVCDLVLGNVLAILESKGKWLKVQLPDGRAGYVLQKHVINLDALKTRPQPEAKEIVDTALRLNGIPYLWGGTSTKGFDCSGFTKTVYRMHGIDLPRDANMQVQMGVPIEIDADYKNLKPGDLLFFGGAPDKITHVGIYIGNKKFIHSDGYVHINSFNSADEEYSEYRVKGLQAVRRILR